MRHPYNTAAYARTLPGEGKVVMSEALGVPLRMRPIPGTDAMDACGTYPLSPDLHDVSRELLIAELADLGIVSLTLVSDPWATNLPDCFDFARPYKAHHVIDPMVGEPEYTKHHRDMVRRGHRRVSTGSIALSDHLDDFIALYNFLADRHNFGAQHRFERGHFEWLAQDPDAFPTYGAFLDGTLVSAHVFALYEDRAYSHLAASSPEGYKNSAAYTVYDVAIRHLSGFKITLGGAPDATKDGKSGGLDAFKAGFANASRNPCLCGLIVDPEKYDWLSQNTKKSSENTTFFPLYRSP